MTLEEITKIKNSFIENRQDNLTVLGRKLQEKIFDALLEKLVNDFSDSNNEIELNNKNISLSTAVQFIFTEVMKNEKLKLITEFAQDINTITNYNETYFGVIETDNQRVFQATAEKVRKLMEFRLGIVPGGSEAKLVKDGFLDSFIKDNTLQNKIQQTILSAVTKKISKADLLRDLRYNLLGGQGFDGPVVAKFNDFLFDVYQQHDRATGQEFATTLGLKAFVYAGGLIDTSRLFCEKRNGKVWTIQEADKWIDDPDLPRTTAERKSGIILNYAPCIDCGRWRCRHHVNWIPKALAIRLRKELIDYFKQAA